jgi:stage II sporulation protein D
MAYYHSTSVGATESPEEVFGEGYPYLRPVEASGRLSPYSLWTRRIPLEEIGGATGVESLQEVRVKTRSGSGRADRIALLSPEEESDGSTLTNTTVRAKDLRRMLGWKRLPSTSFDVRTEGHTAVFEGSGYGHGVGLCQWTALEMALEGKDYRTILDHFYPGATLEPHENLGL